MKDLNERKGYAVNNRAKNSGVIVYVQTIEIETEA
jgi:hypothetical protein